MKKFYILLSFLLVTLVQGWGSRTKAPSNSTKRKQQALVIDYSYTPEAVENAIVEKMEKMGYSAKTEKGLFNKNKGFIIFHDAVISDIDPVQHDYLIKIEKKSRKDDDQTTLYMVIMSGDENQLNTMKTDDVARAKYFLNNLHPDIEDAKLEIEIRGNEETVAKAEKKFKDLQDEKADLEKKLRKNSDELEKQEKLIEVQRASLDTLRGRRRTVKVTPASDSD